MKSIVIGISLLIVSACCASCGGSIPPPTETDAEWASNKWTGTTLQNLNAGRTSYIAKCGSCHSLSSPAQYSAQEWERILEKMQLRAGTSDEEKDLMLKYLVTVRKVQRSETGR